MQRPQRNSNPASIDDLARQLRRLMGAAAAPSAFVALIILNLYILYIRPQNEVTILGKIYLPLALSLVVIAVTALRIPQLLKGPPQIKAMLALLVLGAAWVPLARNNFWAFHTLKDVATQFLGYLFPIYLFMVSGKNLRRLVTAMSCIGLYLGLYSITHGGTGPGAFLGDENDLCLAILTFMGPPLLLLAEPRLGGRKLLFVIALGAMFAGAVATMSRGGFIGLVALLLFLYVRSHRKAAMSVIGFVVIIAGVIFAPADYWKEMSTIQQTTEGTASSRRAMWDISLAIWLHPPHFLFGTGMQNSPYYMGEFEPKVNQTVHAKSYAGRAVHSSFFQLLSDLGLAGLIIVGTVVWTSFVGGNRLVRRLKRRVDLGRRAESRIGTYLRRMDGGALAPDEEAEVLVLDGAKELTAPQVASLLRQTRQELMFTSGLLLGLNASWLGVCGAGFFVSALYYPSFWTLGACSAAARRYAERLELLHTQLLESISFHKVDPDEDRPDPSGSSAYEHHV